MCDNVLYHTLSVLYRLPMIYRVRIAPIPAVIDDSGAPVVGARVLEIIFPTDTIDLAVGRLNVIVGAGTAKIMVAGKILRSIALC